MELTEEEKYNQELKKTSLIKVASVTETNSVFVDLVISKFTKLILKWWDEVLVRSLMAEAMCQPTISGGGRKGVVGKGQDPLHNEPCELLFYWKLKVKRAICNAVLSPVKPFLDSLHTSQKLGRVKLEQLCCPSRNMSGSLAVSGAVCVLPSSPSLHIKTGFSAPFPHKETTCLHRDFSWETKIQPSLPSV